MKHTQQQVVGKKVCRSYQTWSKEELTKLLEFMLMNPNSFGKRSYEEGIFSHIHKHIQSDKTEQDCQIKIKKMLKSDKPYNQLIKDLIIKTNVPQKWVLQKKEAANSSGNSHSTQKMIQIEKRQQWTEQENKKILEFFLLYPHKYHDSRLATDTIEQIRNHINSKKTFKQCMKKIENFTEYYPKYDDLVGYLLTKVDVSQEWIDERKSKKNILNRENYDNNIQCIKQDTLFLENVQRLFISNFNFYEALADRETAGSSEFFLQLSPTKQNETIDNKKPDQLNEILQNSSITSAKQSIKSETEDRIGNLRYCLFLIKFKKQIQNKSSTNLITTIYQKMANFTKTRSEIAWRTYHDRCMMKVENDIEMVIQNNLQNLYVEQAQLERQIQGVEKFYNEEFLKEANAFLKKPKIQLKTSDEKISFIVEKIKQEITKQLSHARDLQENSEFIYQGYQKNDKTENQIGKLLKEKTVIKLSITFDIILSKAQNEQILIKTIKKSPIFNRKMKSLAASRHLEVELQALQKKQKLKAKLQTKNQVQKVSLVQQPQIFEQLSEKYQEEKKDLSSNQNSDNQLFDDQRNESLSDFGNQIKDIEQEDKKSDFSDKTVKKQRKIVQQGIIQSESKSKNSEQIMKQLSNFAQQNNQKKPNRIWSLSERIKIAAFFLANEKIFLEGQCRKKSNFIQKLMNYVGTSKDIAQYQNYLKLIKKHHNNNPCETIGLGNKKYQTSKDLINRCKQLGDFYKKTSQVKVGQDTFIVNSYPIILVSPSEAKLETQIKNLIKRGPFMETKLELHPQSANQSINREKEIGSTENVERVQIQEGLEYCLRVNIPDKIWIERWNFEKNKEEKQKLIKIMMKSIILII